VRDYLIATFPIDLHRLTVVGFGARRLKRPETPNAAINRRVEVALMIP
jgi:flagellar motor protein MotB